MENYTDPFLLLRQNQQSLERKVDYLTELVEKSANSTGVDKPLTVSEAADFLGITPATMYGLHWEKKVRGYKPGKNLYFFPSDLLEYVRSGKQATLEELDMQARGVIAKRRARRKSADSQIKAVVS